MPSSPAVPEEERPPSGQSAPEGLAERQARLEAEYGRAPILDAELEEALRNPPAPVLPENWDEILANPPKLPPEVERALNNPPTVTHDAEVEEIFREQPEVVLPQNVRALIEDPPEVPQPPGS